jgi:hypothetical protein
MRSVERLQRFMRNPVRQKLVALATRTWNLHKLWTPFIPHPSCHVRCLRRAAGERPIPYGRMYRVWIDAGAHLGDQSGRMSNVPFQFAVEQHRQAS